MPEFSLPPETIPGTVALTVTDLARALDFYQNVLGLQLHLREGNSAALGAGGPDLLLLHENHAARRYRGTTGLYHFAVLLPNRRELARVIARIFQRRYPSAPTDHIMTKSTYLNDPDGNGIELYCESPEDGEFVIEGGRFYARRSDGSLSDGREPLDLDTLFAHLQPDNDLAIPMPLETRLGHIHLHVADLDESMRFYRDALGFEDKGLMHTFRMGMVSVGGYHHHIGFNTWQGEGAPPPPADALGLHYFTFLLPDAPSLEAIRAHLQQTGIPFEANGPGIWLQDPSANKILLLAR